MIGTTRSRVSFFMNRFRKLGFISYNGRIRVYKSLLNVVLLDQFPGTTPRSRQFDDKSIVKPINRLVATARKPVSSIVHATKRSLSPQKPGA